VRLPASLRLGASENSAAYQADCSTVPLSKLSQGHVGRIWCCQKPTNGEAKTALLVHRGAAGPQVAGLSSTGAGAPLCVTTRTSPQFHSPLFHLVFISKKNGGTPPGRCQK
jgi:hypothetical protein